MGSSVSLDRPLHDEDDRSMSDVLADPDSEEPLENEQTTIALMSQVTSLLHHLSDIEAAVISMRFGLGDDEELTFREIGEKYQLSRERIRQIQNTALEKLKRAFQREHGGRVEL